MIFEAQFMGAFLTAWINNFILPINSLPSFGTEISTPSEKKNWFAFHFPRIAIAQHHNGTVSEIGSFIWKLPTSATQLEYDSIDDWKAGWIFACECLGTVYSDAAVSEDDGNGSSTSPPRHLLWFELRSETTSSSYHRHSIGCSPYLTSRIDFHMSNMKPDLSRIPYSLIQNPIRWLTPKAPIFKIDENVPTLLNDILKYFLPMGLSIEQRESERQSIHRFVRELNQIRKNHIDRDFSHSYVVNNVTALAESYPFVSIHQQLTHFTRNFAAQSFPFSSITHSPAHL